MTKDNITQWIEQGIKRELIKLDEKNEKIEYIVPRKSYQFNDPEEKVRAKTYIQLILQYKYNPNLLDVEVRVPRRTPNDFADIVIYEDDQHQIPFIVVENKAENSTASEISQGIEQGFGNSNSLRAKYLIVDSIKVRKVFDIQNFPSTEISRNIIPDIPINFGRTPEYKYKKGDSDWDLKRVNFNKLANIFQLCHNELWSGGKRDPAVAFDEMSKLLFAKLSDERNTRNGQFYGFQIGKNESEVQVGERIREKYNSARISDPSIFHEDIFVSDNKIFQVVELLQEVSLIHTDLDVKGRAFEQFLSSVFRGKLGQYFTRRELIEFMVDFIEPDETDVVLDPACGSGGFLLYVLKNVVKQIEDDYKGDDRTISRKIYDYSHYNLFGIEINDKIARVAMMDMIINDDGHTNIESNTALNNNFRISDIKEKNFTLILTNPPFGVKVKAGDRDKLGSNKLENFELRKPKSQKSEILFLEQCCNFLKPQGKMGIVIPDGILSNPSDQNVRDYIFENFKILGVIGVPDFAFRKAGAGMKTSLLFVEKKSKRGQDIEDYEIFMAIADHIGYDATARPDSNDLPEILKYYQENKTDWDKKRFWIKKSQLNNRLNPLYYHLSYLIPKEFSKIKHPIVALNTLVDSRIESGKSPKGGAKYSLGEIPILLIGNILKDGTFNLDEVNYVPQDFYDANKLKAGIKTNDILIAKDGATTGKVAIIPKEFEFDDCMINEHLFRIRLKPQINPHYVYYFLKSDLGQMQIKREISGGAQGGITRDFVQTIQIPIPTNKLNELTAKLSAIESEIFKLREKEKELSNSAKNILKEFLQKSNDHREKSKKR